MANGIEELKNTLMTRRPVEWALLPDIEFYMDQVISFMTRQHIGLEDGELLTPAMVNNYIKHGLLPRAKGKKIRQRAYCLSHSYLSAQTGAFHNRYRPAIEASDERGEPFSIL